MARTLSEMSEFGGGKCPPPGRHLCRVVKAAPWKSPKKGTPATMLTLATRDGNQFEDPLFVGPKALWRLVLAARRVCGMPEDTPIPDDDGEAAKFLARYIVDNAPGKDTIVTIEERDEVFVVTEGPDQGQKKTVKRRRVSAAGYETASNDVVPPPTDDDAGGEIPF